MAAESRAALTERVTTERPFVERLVAFWSNHLCVSVGAKILVAPFAGSYEREVIRPHVLGRFEDMLLASAKHPAMLVYLDNFQSIGPRSRGGLAGRGRGPSRGLNENYARELLELHTLGVDGGYTQQDVQELAKVLTGWTVGGLGRAPSAADDAAAVAAGLSARLEAGRWRRPQTRTGSDLPFRRLLHEPGSKTVLGTRYAEAGVEEGERVIRALVRHPATARFLATKLVTHFVSDEPPASAVDRIARVFRDSEGDLRAVSAALVDLPEAWSEGARKFRTPQDWLVAVLRAFDAGDVSETAMPLLRQLRHPLWSPQAPKGFGDKTQEWADPDSLLNRAELARTIARPAACAQRIDPRILLDVVDVAPAIRCTRCSRTTRLRPTSASRSRWQALHFNGDDHESPQLRTHHVPRRHRDLRISGRQLRADQTAAAGSCSCCCAAASTGSPRSCRTAIRRIDRCAAPSRSRSPSWSS